MKVLVLSALALIFTVPAFAQADKPKTEPAKATAPAAAAKPDAAAPETESAKEAKSLKQALDLWQLDMLAVQTEQNKFAQTDPVAKKASEIFKDAMKNSPEVQKAQETADSDKKALLERIDALRKKQKLDASWEWDFTQGKFVHTTPAAPPATKS